MLGALIMTTAKIRLGKLDDAFTCVPETLEDGVMEINAYSQNDRENVGVRFILTHEKAEELAKDILKRIERKRAKARAKSKTNE